MNEIIRAQKWKKKVKDQHSGNDGNGCEFGTTKLWNKIEDWVTLRVMSLYPIVKYIPRKARNIAFSCDPDNMHKRDVCGTCIEHTQQLVQQAMEVVEREEVQDLVLCTHAPSRAQGRYQRL